MLPAPAFLLHPASIIISSFFFLFLIFPPQFNIMRSFSLFVTASAFLASAAVAADDATVPTLDWIEPSDAAAVSGFAGGAASIMTTDALGSHYGPPADGCEPDEMKFQISGVPGDICAPKCTDGPCPTDMPDGVTAAPTCALKNPATGDKYCVLLCAPSASSSSGESMLRAGVTAGDGQCGEATCQPVQGAGVCTYGDRA